VHERAFRVFHANAWSARTKPQEGAGGQTVQFISPQTFHRADRFPVSDKSNTFLTRCQLTPQPCSSRVRTRRPVQFSLRLPGVHQ